jgi:hypothetical protein
MSRWGAVERHRFAIYGYFILAPLPTMLMATRATDMENAMRVLVATVLFAAFLSSALAQQSAPASDQPAPDQSPVPRASAAPETAPPAMGRQGAGGRQPNPRRVVCVNKARQQGLRGPQMRDAVQLCAEEARLACTKQAIEQKIPAQQRRDFMKNCAG